MYWCSKQVKRYRIVNLGSIRRRESMLSIPLLFLERAALKEGPTYDAKPTTKKIGEKLWQISVDANQRVKEKSLFVCCVCRCVCPAKSQIFLHRFGKPSENSNCGFRLLDENECFQIAERALTWQLPFQSQERWPVPGPWSNRVPRYRDKYQKLQI